VKLELDDFESRLKASEINIKGEETRKINLEKELELANKATQSLLDSALYLEGELKKLKGILPAPIYSKVQALYERMPADPKTTKVSLAERYQNILGILNEADKANSEITVLAEVRELPGTPATEVETIYVGLAQAYFVNAERNPAKIPTNAVKNKPIGFATNANMDLPNPMTLLDIAPIGPGSSSNFWPTLSNALPNPVITLFTFSPSLSKRMLNLLTSFVSTFTGTTTSSAMTLMFF
jgi:hypothetical protein